MGNRKWFLLSGSSFVHGGSIGRIYHQFSKKERRTVCGIVLPEAYGMFVDLRQTTKEQKEARCEKCVAALKKGKSK